MYTFLVTKMTSEPKQFAAMSSPSTIVNVSRLQIHVLACNLFNWFKRLSLPASMRKHQIDTIRLKLLKIAAQVVPSAIGMICNLKLDNSMTHAEHQYGIFVSFYRL